MTQISIPNLALLRRLLHLPPDTLQTTANAQLTFAAAWQTLTVLALLFAAFVWFTFHYWRDGTRPRWWIKAPLVVLRLIAVAALMTTLAQPTLRLAQSERVRPNVVVVVDSSQSMAVSDPKLPASRARVEGEAAGSASGSVGRLTRLDRVNALLNTSGMLAELSKRYNVHAYAYASQSHSLNLPADPKQRNAYRFAVPPDAKGDSTQMGDALRRPLEDLAGQPIAGAIVLSDGGSNLGEEPALVADTYRQARIPLSTIGIGDPTQTKDIALLSVLADDVVRTNNNVAVYAALSQRGYAGKTVAVTLQRGNEIVGRETVRLAANDQKQEVHFSYVPTQAGRFYYSVAVTPLPGEVTIANNKRSFVQTVISKKLKVLYVENEPRYEYRYLRNAILRDTSLEFSSLLLTSDEPSEGGIPIREFPKDEKTLFDYDIIVLGDVPRSLFSDAQLESLRRFVEDRGGSMLVIAGEQHMPHEYAGTPLEAVLPVVISPSPDPVLTEEPFQWQRTPEGRRSPIFQLEDDANANDAAWNSLRGMFWAAGVPRAKPGATVLAVHPARRSADGAYPLVATQPFGAGKCFVELVDSTWLWRWRVGDRYFYRYWGQVFRSLTPKELPGNSRYVQLNADRTNYRLGEKVSLSARLLNAFYRPIKAESVTAFVKGENGQTQKIVLSPAPGSPGLFTAEFQPERVGHYEVSLTSPVNLDAKATAAFVVESLALEKQRPELDEMLLKKVASAGGGKYYAPNALKQWMASLPDNGLTVHSDLEIELWDKPLGIPLPFLLLLFLIPLALEWLVRKRTGLL